MSKICIIGLSNLKHISLISIYTEFFDKNGIPYDVIYIDRHNINEEINAKRKYVYKSGHINNKIEKMMLFMKFRKFAKTIINENKYEYIITWQTTAAYLFADILFLKYKNKHIVNVRDYVCEDKIGFRFLIKKIVKSSKFTTISSDGFRTFLPQYDYVKVNSINERIFDLKRDEKKSKRKSPYIIGFAGNCRYFRESFKLIQALKNDKRFELWYCGTNSEKIEEFANENNIENVITMPGFDIVDTISIFENFDIVNSVFGNDALDNRTLIPIRLYTALNLDLPILVNEDTELAKEVRVHNIGFIIENYDLLADDLYEYLSQLDEKLFGVTANNYIKNAIQENQIFKNKLFNVFGDEIYER